MPLPSIHSCTSMLLSLCLHSLSSAHYLYPVRIRVVNDVSGVVEWHTIAYVPFVRKLKEPSSKHKAKGRRWGVLQRTLYLAFRDAISASHKGAALHHSVGGYSLAFFRILLYSCDQPEERAVLCLKAGNCERPCSNCDVLAADACTAKGTEGVPRHVIDAVEGQMEAAALSRAGKKRKRRLYLEAQGSMNAFVPALACMGGLTTVPHHLYKMIAIDPLHVRFPRSLVVLLCCFRTIVFVEFVAGRCVLCRKRLTRWLSTCLHLSWPSFCAPFHILTTGPRPWDHTHAVSPARTHVPARLRRVLPPVPRRERHFSCGQHAHRPTRPTQPGFFCRSRV